MSDRDGTPLEPGCTGPHAEYCPVHPRRLNCWPDRPIPPVVPAPSLDEIREELAALAHEQWSGWMRYLFGLTVEVGDGCEEIQREQVDRWKRQMTTAYAALSEAEKDSDRKEADRVLAILQRHFGAKEKA